MAGDWIKMRGNLWDDPRVASICDATDQGEATIIGALYWLWATADQHSEDGFLPGMSLRSIDRKVGVPGFAAAQVAIGWLAEEADGVRIINFGDHNGESAKKRAETARRVAKHRSGNAQVTQPALQDENKSDTGALARVREREEKEQEGLVALGAQNFAREAGESRNATPDPQDQTRKGALCKALRGFGIDAAPHMAAWAELLPAYSDEEILAAGETAKERKPGERVSLNYLLPMLRDGHKPNARASPRRESLRERQQHNVDILTGRAHREHPEPHIIDIN